MTKIDGKTALLDDEITLKIKQEYPEFEKADYWWIDDLIESITFGKHETFNDCTLTVNWKCGIKNTMSSGTGLMKKNIYKKRIIDRYRHLEFSC